MCRSHFLTNIKETFAAFFGLIFALLSIIPFILKLFVQQLHLGLTSEPLH